MLTFSELKVTNRFRIQELPFWKFGFDKKLQDVWDNGGIFQQNGWAFGPGRGLAFCLYLSSKFVPFMTQRSDPIECFHGAK